MDQHDDGLVHSHSWAREQPRHRPTDGRRVHGDARPAASATRPGDDHDDGIDHGHAWACSDRGRPRH